LDVTRLNPVDDDPSLCDFNNKFSPYRGWSLSAFGQGYIGLSINFIESNRYDDNEVAFKEKIITI
jgi:hypothetical protein